MCDARLAPRSLGCDECGTEVHGRFSTCDFCSLDDAQRDLLRVFLAARGNTKELERHLGVSYPTARARLEDLLRALDIDAPASTAASRRRDVLGAVARGEMGVEEAVEQLA